MGFPSPIDLDKVARLVCCCPISLMLPDVADPRYFPLSGTPDEGPHGFLALCYLGLAVLPSVLYRRRPVQAARESLYELRTVTFAVRDFNLTYILDR